MYEELTKQAKTAICELLEVAKLAPGDIFIVGCSTSEVCGEHIGKGSSIDAAEALWQGIGPILKEKGIYLAAQCCEHLNRAVIIEAEAAKKFGYEPVNVVPQPKAGGSFATTTYKYMENPVAVEAIRADAGIDIHDLHTNTSFCGMIRVYYNIRKTRSQRDIIYCIYK